MLLSQVVPSGFPWGWGEALPRPTVELPTRSPSLPQPSHPRRSDFVPHCSVTSGLHLQFPCPPGLS